MRRRSRKLYAIWGARNETQLPWQTFDAFDLQKAVASGAKNRSNPALTQEELMIPFDKEHVITDVTALERLYGLPSGAAVEKEVSYIHPHYRAMIEASPFVVLATSGPDGLDTSPRGDPAGFVVVEDEKTLLIPDRRGNNRADSLRNIIADPRIALLFLIPGVGETLRVNGRALISTAPWLLERFAMNGRLPRSVIVVQVETVFFQCSRAIWRSKLWDPEQHVDRKSLPSLGTIVGDISGSRIDPQTYDTGLYERLKASLY